MKLSIKKFEKSRTRILRGFAVPLILLLQISLPGVALCIGYDGHTALENFSEGLCSEGKLSSESQNIIDYYLQALNSPNSQHCGICIDIPISDKNSENKVISSNDLLANIDVLQFALYKLADRASIETLNNHFILRESPSNFLFIASLHTTVITC